MRYPRGFQVLTVSGPAALKIGDTYYVCYSLVSYDGGTPLADRRVGVATADHPSIPFTDQGGVVTSRESGVLDSIDPHVFIEDYYLRNGVLRRVLMIDSLRWVDGWPQVTNDQPNSSQRRSTITQRNKPNLDLSDLTVSSTEVAPNQPHY